MLVDYSPSLIGEGDAANYVNGTWIGSLTEIEEDKGYWVKVDHDVVLTVGGIPPNYEIVYSLHLGSNLISYPFRGFSPINFFITS